MLVFTIKYTATYLTKRHIKEFLKNGRVIYLMNRQPLVNKLKGFLVRNPIIVKYNNKPLRQQCSRIYEELNIIYSNEI